MKNPDFKRIKAFVSAFLGILAMILMAMSMAAFSAPEMIAHYLNPGHESNPGHNSLWIIYGGINMSLGLFLAYSARCMRKSGLGLISIYMIGLVIGRLVRYFSTGQLDSFILLELGVLLISAFLFKKMIEATGGRRLQIAETDKPV